MRKLPTTIRQLASSRTGNVLAAGERKHVVHLYDLTTAERLSTIQTTLDFGGRRLAISNDGGTVVAGAYDVHGIAAYSGVDGRELWRRNDLQKVQHITFGADDAHLFCGFEEGPCQMLDTFTGNPGMSFRGATKIWESPFSPVRLFQRSNDYALGNAGGPVVTIPRESFAILSAAFSTSLVVISEAGGPVRAFNLHSGTEVWRHTPAKGVHFTRVAFCDELRAFAGVSWAFEKGDELSLHLFANDSGVPARVADVGPAVQVAFCRGGSRLVTTAGSIFNVPTGARVAVLAFPAPIAS